MEKITEKIVNFISEITLEQIPINVIDRAKLHFLDVLGTLLAGSASDDAIGKTLCRYVKHLGGKPEALVVKGGFRTSPPFAALANGTIANALDYDDVDWPSKAHPSAVIFPAVLALGEALNRSGKEVLASYILGVEIMTKIGLGMGSDHWERGWDTTSTLGTLGAAAASARLFELRPLETHMALGIAASKAGGIRGNFGSMTKALHIGMAAKNGIIASGLAKEGLTAAPDIMEIPMGFPALFTAEARMNKAVDDLGVYFSFTEPGMAIKLYPSCASTHSTLDGVLHLVHEHDLRPEDIKSVECGISSFHTDFLIQSSPTTGLEGKYSLEFCVALALTERCVNINHFNDSGIRNPELKKLMAQVKVSVSPDVGGEETQFPGAVVKIRLKNGMDYSYKVEKRKGAPGNPLLSSEISNKFTDCAGLVQNEHRIKNILNTVMNLESMAGIRKLVELIEK